MRAMTNDDLMTKAPAVGASMPIADVSDKYSFIRTLDVVDLLRDQGWFPVSARQAHVRKQERDGFQKHLIRFTREGFYTGQERVDMVLHNSHDRGCAFKLSAAIWRKICGNGLMVASDLYNFSHRHVGFDPDALLESATTIAESATEIAGSVDEFKCIDMTQGERGVYAMAAHSLLYDEPEKAPIKPVKLLHERRYDDKGNDLWTTFNVVQENVMKGGLHGAKRGSNGRMRRQKTRPVKSIDRDVKLNKALWILTEEMARLKA
jgi:hypothetical protein